MSPLDSAQLLNSYTITLMLMFVRIFSIFFLAPLFSNTSIPAHLRVGLAILVMVVLYPVAGHFQLVSSKVDLCSLVFLVMKEGAVGLSIGFAGMVVLSVVIFSGDILSRMMGLAEANLIDPLFNENVDAISQLQFVLFMLIFLSLNGHHFIIRLVAKSFELVPLGSVVINGKLIAKISTMIGEVFVLGVQFAAPIFAFQIITSVAFGIIGRAVPEMDLLILLLPIKVFVGLVGMIIIFPLFFYFIDILIRRFYLDLNMILHLV